jgi:molybdopterin-binding protein
MWSVRGGEADLLPLVRELGIGFVPYSPRGHGFLTGDIRSPEQLSDDDWRKTHPRFTGENFQRNLRIVDEVTVRGADGVIESVITRRSAEEMGLKKGDLVTAVVKATEVMIAKP